MLWLTTFGFGQLNVATLSGRVTDSSGAVIPGAQVTLLREQSNTSIVTQTDPAGLYVFSNLSLGGYKLTVSHTSFKRYVQTGIFLSAGDNRQLNVTLQVGQTTQTVQVVGEAPLLETQTGSLDTTEDTKTLESYEFPPMRTGLRRMNSCQRVEEE